MTCGESLLLSGSAISWEGVWFEEESAGSPQQQELSLNSDNSLALLVVSWFAVHPDISFAKIHTSALSDSWAT